MKIITRKFGEIEIDEKKILDMPEGLPGFEKFTRFAILEDPKTVPLCWFQSLEEPSLSLAIMDPLIFMPDYTVDLDAVISLMNWNGIDKKNLVVYVVVNISDREKEKKITANLIGPMVINVEASQVVQVVFPDSNYSHQHDILGA